MKFALINPNWTFDGSIYFGCREPHLPLEFGYARALLERAGHEVLLVDAQLHDLTAGDLRARVEGFAPDHLVITTAPSYLFWRCAPPELRVPQDALRSLHAVRGTRIVVGPHASTTPAATLRKLSADVAVMGECEDILPALAGGPPSWRQVDSIAWTDGTSVHVQGGVHQVDMAILPALRWSRQDLSRHVHHHHRFDRPPSGAGAEVEVSRGCPYHCTFCAKDSFRSDYRRRSLPVVLDEVDGLIAGGVEYVYFIDEIFLPNRELLEALALREVTFGVQTRIDLWTPSMLDLLGRAGCVSIEAGVESVSVEGRNLLDKGSRLTTEQLADRLAHAKRTIAFVQANLLEAGTDDPADVERWRARLHEKGVWANKPVPMFPYPGSPTYRERWGAPDAAAWERALAFYLAQFDEFSDIQDDRPRPLSELEHENADAR